jgi:glycine betaine/proline transport system substrate-binding protein
MFKRNRKIFMLIMMLALSVALVGCSGSDDSNGDKDTGAEEAKDLGEQMDYQITGIDAGAGVMQAAEQAVEDYDLDFDVKTSSGAVMTQALGDAVENEEPIIVTGWTPHWKFVEYELKYLDDPKESFGGEETINTIVRLGLKEDSPNAYKVLDQFNWETADMESVMLEISQGTEAEDAAQNWIEDNQDKVNEWIDGVEEVDGKEIELAYVAWDSTIASTNVVKIVLEDLGFDVTTTQVEAGPMWAAVASGDADAFLAGWLPITHEAYLNDYADEVEDLGPNLEGAKIGLVVPVYMDIDSIEDLANYKK